MLPNFNPIDDPVMDLTFYKQFQGARFPERGSEGAAGMDFFIPCPTSFDDNCFDYIMQKCLDLYEEDSENAKAIRSRFEAIKDKSNVQDAFLEALVVYNSMVFNNKDLYVRTITEYNGKRAFLVLEPGTSVMIPSGISADIPHGYALDFRNKSGIASKKDLIVGAELVDEDYTGIMHLNIHNIGRYERTLTCGMKICQAVVERTYYDNLRINNVEGRSDRKTARGEGGFGSTGV